MIAVARGVGEADLKRPGALRLANGPARRRLVRPRAGAGGQYQKDDDAGRAEHLAIIKVATASQGLVRIQVQGQRREVK